MGVGDHGLAVAAHTLREAAGHWRSAFRVNAVDEVDLVELAVEGPGYDTQPERRFEFIPIWGFAVVLRYRMRRVQCRACGVKVEAVPWGIGKHPLTRAYLLYRAHWAKKLSWKETAQSFHSSWEKVCQAVEYVVPWGLEQRPLGPIRAIGVDEIQYGRGHNYLTLVYQIEACSTTISPAGNCSSAAAMALKSRPLVTAS